MDIINGVCVCVFAVCMVVVGVFIHELLVDLIKLNTYHSNTGL